MGNSLIYQKEVTALINEHIAPTAERAVEVAAVYICTATGTLLGIISGY